VPIATTAAVTPATDAAVFGFARNHDSAFIVSYSPGSTSAYVVSAVLWPLRGEAHRYILTAGCEASHGQRYPSDQATRQHPST
jgi:hypothetical protein